MSIDQQEIAWVVITAEYPTGEVREVRLSILQPHMVGNAWCCEFVGQGLVEAPVKGIYGNDSLQALALALAILKRQLNEFVAQGGRVTYAGTGIDYPIEHGLGAI